MTEIEDRTSHTVDFPLPLDKTAIGEVILDAATLDAIQPQDAYLHFWFDVANLRDWLMDRSLAAYGSRFFPTDQQPLLVYFQNTWQDIDGTELFPSSRSPTRSS